MNWRHHTLNFPTIFNPSSTIAQICLIATKSSFKYILFIDIMALLIVVTANSDRPFTRVHRACIWETTLVTFRNNMASNVPKRESLSRYFKDLEEYESDSDDSNDEVNKVEKTSDRKINDLVPQLDVSFGRADDSKVTARNIVAENAQKKLIAVDGNSNTAAKQENKLPSALDCLNSRTIPNFLKLRAKKEVDWDFCEKRLDGDETTEYVNNAVPPPSSYEPVVDLGTKVVDSEGRKRKTIVDDLEDQMTSAKAYKVHKEDDNNEET